MDQKQKNAIKKIIEKSQQKIRVLEEDIDLETHQEYIAFHNQIDFEKYSDEQILQSGKELLSGKYLTEDKKKEILILLAHLEDSRAFHLLDRYLSIASRSMKKWAILCFQENYNFLESALAEEECGFISAAVGGKNNKLRYYFIISSKLDKKFTSKEKTIIHTEFVNTSCNKMVEIEDMSFNANYALFKVLVSIDEAIGNIIEQGINKCNQHKDFLRFHYYVTNIKRPSKKEIINYLSEINK